MQIFRPTAIRLHLFVLQPETDVVTVADHRIVAKVKQESPFCRTSPRRPTAAGLVHAEGYRQDAVFDAKPPSTDQDHRHRAITNHVNFAHTAKGTSLMSRSRHQRGQVFRTDDSRKSRPFRSANCRMACGRRAMARASMSASRTTTADRDRHRTNQVIATIHRPGAAGDRLCSQCCTESGRRQNLQALACGSRPTRVAPKAGSRVSGADQRVAVRPGLIQVLQAAVTGLEPKQNTCWRCAQATAAERCSRLRRS